MLGPLGSNNYASSDIHAVDFSLDSLRAEASTFARIALKDAEARATYVRRIAGIAAQIRSDVLQGQITAEQGCRFANEMRNVIMHETRAITSALARAAAETAKRTGLTLEAALEKSVKQLYPGKTFADLSTDQKRSIFMEVIDASGRSSPRFTRLIPILNKLGKRINCGYCRNLCLQYLGGEESGESNDYRKRDGLRWICRRRSWDCCCRICLRARRTGLCWRIVHHRRDCRCVGSPSGGGMGS